MNLLIQMTGEEYEQGDRRNVFEEKTSYNTFQILGRDITGIELKQSLEGI